jgi:hypothetical protein
MATTISKTLPASKPLSLDEMLAERGLPTGVPLVTHGRRGESLTAEQRMRFDERRHDEIVDVDIVIQEMVDQARERTTGS